jgi:hypothetical protein
MSTGGVKLVLDTNVIISEDRHFRPYRTNEHPPLLVLTIEELKAKYQKG